MFDNKKINLEANQSLVLAEHDRFWMITSGEVDVFYVKIEDDGTYSSSLNYIYSSKSGELIFSLISSAEREKKIKLLIVSKGASLLEVSKTKLLDIDHFFLQKMIDKWVLKIGSTIQKTHAPRLYSSLTPAHSVALNKDLIAYPNKGIVWGITSTGSVIRYAEKIFTETESEHNHAFAISKDLWITVHSDKAELRLLTTKEVLKDEIYFMLSLNDLQNHLYHKLIENFQIQIEEELSRIQEKVVSEDTGLKKTLGRLGNVVMGKQKDTAITNDNKHLENELFIACQLIGNADGFTFIPPRHLESYESNTTNQLYAIAQSSKVRVRKIILRGTWWKEENGHLLAFRKDTKQPVALIQRTSDTYHLKDSTTAQPIRVNSEIADQLEPIGYMFFYGFYDTMNSVRKIAKYASQGIRKDSKYLLLAAFLGSLMGLLIPVLSGIMFDDVIPDADKSLHVEVFIIMLLIGFITAGLQLVRGILLLRVETKSSINMQAGVMDHLLRLPVTFYKKFSAGDLTNRALSINAIRQILSNTVMTAVLSGAFSFVNLVLLFYYESSLAWIGVGLAVIAVLFMTGIGWLKLKYDRQISDIQGDLQGFLFEFLSGITKIRITGGEKRVFTLWADKFSKLKQLGFNSGSYQNFVEVFNGSYPLLTSIFFFAFIYATIGTGEGGTSIISVGAFMAFIGAFNQFLGDCLRMSMALITSLNMVTLYERVKPILEEKPESSEGTTDPGELMGEIEINSVSFRYHEEQPLILKDISFHIKPGEMVAFVGTSGSGKSTIMRLLLGFEEPEVGSIYYDGDAFDSMHKDLVRRQIGVVLQNGALMSGSIYKNIVGNSELTLEDAWEAARMAGMEEDIKQMPMEMHTVISEGAGTFSGGQRQRLMIARAIVHKPRLLFMDEATSALDNRTQNIVSESLDKLQATRIVIAHRLSTIKNADRIFVLDKGTIVESGNYEELMQKNGVFSALAKRQIA